MFKKGDAVRVEGFSTPSLNGIEATVSSLLNDEIAYICVTKPANSDQKIGFTFAMWLKNLVPLSRPEEMICEDWS